MPPSPAHGGRDRIADRINAYSDAMEKIRSPHAARNRDAVRRQYLAAEDIRPPYSRDADRILHSKAYTRYIDKTQVFYLVHNDHITHRVLHVQLVAKIARTIGRALRLNEDLVEAIALGHDIGHPPFGHFGERCLSGICEEQDIGRFFHNIQSVWFLDRIEGCDLTLQVLDGILCHNGESDAHSLTPQHYDSWEVFDRRITEIRYREGDPHPMTLEGCVVRLADTIAYIGRDLQDAYEVALIGEDEALPESCTSLLGTENRSIVDTLIWDLLLHSDTTGDPCISHSPGVARALRELKEFSIRHIYENPQLISEQQKIRGMYQTIFTRFLDDIEEGRTSSKIFTDFIDRRWLRRQYLEEAAPAELVRDFLAGMTDRYFEARFQEMVIPRRIEGTFRRRVRGETGHEERL
jgi:dGTPase